MATFSGVSEYKICNGYITLSVEWRVEQDILNSTNTYYYDIYVDTSKCASAKYEGTGIIDLRGSKIPDITFKINDYELSRLDRVGKNKIGSCHTEAQAVGEEATSFSINLGHTGYFYAYTDLTTYVKDNIKDNSYRWYTVNGITRTTAGDIYGDYILGNTHTLKLTRVRDEFTHKVEYYCKNSSKLLLLDNSKVETINFEPPVEWSAQNTTGTTVSVTFDVTTYYDGTPIGTKTKTVTFTMPPEVKPSCTVAVRDYENLIDTYGGYVQRQSRLYINVTPTLSYNSPIVKYEISANGAIYDIETNTFTTGVLRNSGKQTVSVVVTDGRGRTGTATVEIDVIPWSKPDAIKINTFRTDVDGNNDSEGEYITAHFDASVSPVNNKNSASYKIQYKKVSGLGQGEDNLDEYQNVYSITDGTHTFKADKDSTYEVTLIVTDDFDEDSISRGGSNAVVLMHFGSDGESMAIGGLATLRGVLDVFFKLYPRGGFVHPKLTSIDETTPNTYYCDSPQDLELPSRLAADVNDPFIFEVIPISDDGENVMQRITTCPSDVNEKPLVLVRSLQGENWNPWFDVVSGKDYA